MDGTHESSGAVAGRIPPSASPPLVGRGDELAALVGVLADTAAGRGGTAVVEGEAGIGKTRLVQEAVATAPATLTVLTGQADELDRDTPFGAVAEAFAGAGLDTGVLRVRDEGAPAGLPSPPSRGWRFRALEEVLAALEALALDHPAVLVLEDVHWADPATLLLVERLARRGSQGSITAVVTCRPSPRPPALDRLLDLIVRLGHPHLRLGRLGLGQVTDLVEAVVGTQPGASLLAAAERAAGNPLYCMELLAALAGDDAITVRAGRAEVGAFTLPGRLRKLIGRRLRALPGDGREVLQAASVLGTTFAVDDLAVMLDRPASQLVRALAEPVASGVLDESGSHLRFRHALVRDACYAGLPRPLRDALHLQAARAFAAAGRPARQVARHYLRGATTDDGAAVAWLARAGREATGRAPETAVELLDAALALGGEAGPERDGLHAERGMALMWSGRVEEGEAALRALLERPHDPSVDTPARLALGQSLLLQARAMDAVAVLEESAGRPAVSADAQAQLLADAALARLVGADISGAADVGERTLAAARRAGDAAAACVALSVLAAVEGLRGRTAEGLALAEEAVEVSSASPARDASRRPPQLFQAALLVELDRPEEGEKAVQTARRISEDCGAVWDLPVAHILSARGHFHAGDLADAEAELEAALAQAEEVGTLVLRVWAHAMRAHILILRDDLPAAEAAMEAGEADVAVYGLVVQGTDWLVWARALWAEARGDADTALTVLRAVWQGHAERGILSERRLLGPDYVRLCLSAGRRDEAREVAAAVEEAAQLNGSSSARGAALRCRGLAESDPDVLRAAVEVCRGAPRRMEYAAACEEAAGVLAADGQTEEAAALLREALGIVERRGAARPAARVDAALRGLGVRRGTRGRRSRPPSGWDALTETEQRVTGLVAEGLTNPQIGARMFISRRTVETHLSHVFAKLGISSRVELAARAATREG